MSGASTIFAGLDAITLAYALIVVFIAAIVRGYSGFGTSALMVTSLSLVIPPVEVVPIALFMEIVASLGLLRQVWTDVAWRAIKWLMIGAALGMPAGFALLAALPEEVMRAVISVLVLSASAAIWFGYQLRSEAHNGHTFATGIVSGVANGTAAVGGLPVVLFFLSTSAGIVVSRATLIVYLMLGDIYGAGVAYANGLIDTEVLQRSALFCLPLLLGVWAGNRHFLKTTPESFRRFTLILLMFLASLGLLRAILG